jgi:hypothetical protein
MSSETVMHVLQGIGGFVLALAFALWIIGGRDDGE